MTSAVKHQLFRLIKSLSKAEKRNFTIYSTRAAGNAKSKFIQLFQLLDRLEEPDDDLVTTRLKLSPGQYSNLKRHLYSQVLTSLRLLHITGEIDIELREQLDFARILYGKGHYLDALRLLERAKTKAVEHSQDLIHLEILEFQKVIEARHVTLSRQVHNKMDLLLNESAERSYSVLNTSELFNMNIQIHGRYIEAGHSRNAAEKRENAAFWNEIQTVRVDRETVASTFHQKINRFQAAMWYHYIQLDFVEALEAAVNAAVLFQLSSKMIVKDPDLYLRCLYYVCVFAYLTHNERELARYLNRLREFLDDKDVKLNENSRRIGFVYRFLSEFNLHFLRRDDDAAAALAERVRALHAEKTFRPGPHRWALFLYKFAAAAFRVGAYSDALDHLNDILNGSVTRLRDELVISTRLLHALCHFELGNYSLVEYHLNSLVRLLRRSPATAEMHRTLASGLRKLINTPVYERPAVFEKLTSDVNALRSIPFESKALQYLEAGDWLALHTTSRPAESDVAARFPLGL